MHADVARADRAQDRVGQRVQPDIGVGMADEAGIMRDLDPADHDAVARAEGMGVEPLADPHIAEIDIAEIDIGRAGVGRAGVDRMGGDQPFGGSEIRGRRHFQIVLAAGDQQRHQPRRFGDRRIIGQLPPDGGAMGGEDRIETEALRRLRAPQLGPVEGRADRPVFGALDRVGQGQRWDRRPHPVEPVDHPVDQRRIRKRPRSVMDQHPAGSVGRQRLEPEPHRILPGGAARHRRQHTQARGRSLEPGPVFGPDRHQHAGDPRVPGECRHGMAQHHSVAEGQVLLGQGAPETAASSGGDHQRINLVHAQNYPMTRSFAIVRAPGVGSAGSRATAANVALQKETR